MEEDEAQQEEDNDSPKQEKANSEWQPHDEKEENKYVFGSGYVEGLWSTKKSQFRERFCQKQIVFVTHPLFTHPPIPAVGPLYPLSKITWGTPKSPQIWIPPGVRRLTGGEAQLAMCGTLGPPFYFIFIFYFLIITLILFVPIKDYYEHKLYEIPSWKNVFTNKLFLFSPIPSLPRSLPPALHVL
jgi:hypothetical protein